MGSGSFGFNGSIGSCGAFSSGMGSAGRGGSGSIGSAGLDSGSASTDKLPVSMEIVMGCRYPLANVVFPGRIIALGSCLPRANQGIHMNGYSA